MSVKQEFINAVNTGREIEFSYNSQNYFESRTSQTNWYIYHEETKTYQYFKSSKELILNTILQDKNINDIWEEISINYIL